LADGRLIDFFLANPPRPSEIHHMSGPSTYVPKSAIGRWFESRLPLFGFVHSSFIAYPVPRNLNYMWAFGAILSFMLVAQIVTGVVLAMHYVPSANAAFSSVDHIMRNVNYGWLIRYLHTNGASLFFFAVYIHMLRGLYYGSFKPPRELLWIIGVIIYFLMMATAFLGYVLPWGSMSFAGATVITNLTSAIPLVGNSIAHWLWGGFAVGGPTLTRFFSLHYLLPFIIVAFVALHVWALHVTGQNNPDGVEVKELERDTVAFTPYATIKDLFGLSVFLILYAWLVFFIPNYLLDADNSIPANPLATPAHVVPEWYLLPFYAMLRAIPNKLMGVIVLLAAIVVLAFIPWLDRSPVKSAKYRPSYRFFFWIFVAIGIGLGYLGSQEPTEGLALIARILTFGYFAFFLIIMPILSFTEKTKPIPTSIADAVLTKTKTAVAAAE
jgi:ubiquinol-cytochrome c reductase cytochrome b subunit